MRLVLKQARRLAILRKYEEKTSKLLARHLGGGDIAACQCHVTSAIVRMRCIISPIISFACFI